MVKSALAFATILITEHAKLPFAIATKPMRAKQPMPALVIGFDWLSVGQTSL